MVSVKHTRLELSSELLQLLETRSSGCGCGCFWNRTLICNHLCEFPLLKKLFSDQFFCDLLEATRLKATQNHSKATHRKVTLSHGHKAAWLIPPEFFKCSRRFWCGKFELFEQFYGLCSLKAQNLGQKFEQCQFWLRFWCGAVNYFSQFFRPALAWL